MEQNFLLKTWNFHVAADVRSPLLATAERGITEVIGTKCLQETPLNKPASFILGVPIQRAAFRF